MPNYDPSQLKSFLESAHQLAILLPKNPNYDSVAAALSLKLSLEQINKVVTVVSPEPVTVEFHRLVGADTITNTIGGRNLIITFPGQTELVDKVSYNIEGGVLQLVVTPKANTAGLDHNKLQFVSSGAGADALILIGVKDVNELGTVYEEAKELFMKVPQFSLNEALNSQTVTQIMHTLGLPFTADIASNLLSALERATNNFQDVNATAETFEAAALLLRQGGRRQTNLAEASEFPQGSIPTPPPADWTEPKIYRGTTLS